MTNRNLVILINKIIFIKEYILVYSFSKLVSSNIFLDIGKLLFSSSRSMEQIKVVELFYLPYHKGDIIGLLFILSALAPYFMVVSNSFQKYLFKYITFF